VKNGFGLVVLGMHRSGTSALTGSLRHLGVELGGDMRAPHEGVNAKGYWEHLGILRVHESVLTVLASSWDDVRPLPDRWREGPELAASREQIVEILRRDFSRAAVWAVKDPRTCRLVPLWVDALERLGCRFGFVLTMRNPAEVIRSLAKRDGFHADKSALLWLENNLAAEQATRSHPRVFLSYDDLLKNPRAALSRIELQLDVRFPKRFDEGEAAVHSFLTPQLRHHVAGEAFTPETSGKNAALIAQVHRALIESCLGESEETRRLWDGAQRDYAQLVGSYEPGVASHIADLQDRVAKLTRRIEALESSTFWQVTRPLRKVERIVMRAFERS
jgi:hypothetical protein